MFDPMDKSRVVVFAVLALDPIGLRVHDEADHAKHHKFNESRVEGTAFGREDDPRKVDQTIRIDMADTMRFSPDRVVVKRGQTIRFVIHNDGQVLHEMVLGTPKAHRAEHGGCVMFAV